MPVDTTHKEYSLNVPKWRKIRTVLEGQDSVKDLADTYVPRPRGFKGKDELWKEYIERGEFFPAASRTVVGLLGAMFRRAPVVELPKTYEPWKNTITQNGLSVEAFSKLCSKELLEMGRFGIFVDMPVTEGYTDPTVKKKARPFLSGYAAEQIINWAEATVEDPQNPGVYLTLPVLVVLKECVSVQKADDIFEREEVEQYRVLSIDESGFYLVEVWQKLEKKESNSPSGKAGDWVRSEIVEPKGPTGKRLQFIPFVFVSPDNTESAVERSPIEDLVAINLSHFNTALDLEWACHLTACPTIYVTGWESKGKSLAFGSGVVWDFESPEVKLDILEYKGDGIASLENRARVKEDKMAKLGANLLRAKNKQPETAETTRIEHSAESSILSMIARNSSAAITQALGWAVWWASGLESEAKAVSVEQNTEFYDARLTYQELDSLMAGVQAGTIPVSVYVFNLIRGDMVKAGTTQEELEKEVEATLQKVTDEKTKAAELAAISSLTKAPPGEGNNKPAPSPTSGDKAAPSNNKEKAPGSPGK